MSPKGVKYYEYKNNFINALTDRIGSSSPTGANIMNKAIIKTKLWKKVKKFPSPTGVNYYEYKG